MTKFHDEFDESCGPLNFYEYVLDHQIAPNRGRAIQLHRCVYGNDGEPIFDRDYVSMGYFIYVWFHQLSGWDLIVQEKEFILIDNLPLSIARGNDQFTYNQGTLHRMSFKTIRQRRDEQVFSHVPFHNRFALAGEYLVDACSRNKMQTRELYLKYKGKGGNINGS